MWAARRGESAHLRPGTIVSAPVECGAGVNLETDAADGACRSTLDQVQGKGARNSNAQSRESFTKAATWVKFAWGWLLGVCASGAIEKSMRWAGLLACDALAGWDIELNACGSAHCVARVGDTRVVGAGHGRRAPCWKIEEGNCGLEGSLGASWEVVYWGHWTEFWLSAATQFISKLAVIARLFIVRAPIPHPACIRSPRAKRRAHLTTEQS